MFDKQHDILDDEDDNDSTETSIFDHLAFDIFIFLMAITSIVVVFLVLWSCRIKTRSRPSAFEYLLHIFTNV